MSLGLVDESFNKKEIKLESTFRMIQERSIAHSGVASAKGKIGKQLTSPSQTISLLFLNWLNFESQGIFNIIDHTITRSCNGPTGRSGFERKSTDCNC